MEKKFELKVEVQANNTPQTWTFSPSVTGIEQLAIWVLIKELAEKQIRKIIN